MAEIREHNTITNENVDEQYDYIFAPWVKEMGLVEISVSEGKASAILPQNPALQWANGAICGQVRLSTSPGASDTPRLNDCNILSADL